MGPAAGPSPFVTGDDVTTAAAAVVHKLLEVPIARAMHRIADSLPRPKAAKAEAD
jgi:hypothetical protein